MVNTITHICKVFRYGVKSDNYDKFIGIKEFSERLALDFLNNHFSDYTGTPAKGITLLDELHYGETFSNFRSIHFSSSDSRSTEVRNIYDITLKSASSPAYTLVASTIGSQHISGKKEIGREVCIKGLL